MSDVASAQPSRPVVMLPAGVFLAGCAIVAGGLLLAARVAAMPLWLLGAEVLLTILGLFLFGSFRYQIHKNALTYGMLLIIVATFAGLATSGWHAEIADQGAWHWLRQHLR